MTDVLYGKVLSVETRNLAEPTVAAASIGATTLFVSDATTFNEGGGFVTVGGQVLAYVATYDDTNTIQLDVPLTVAVEDQALVEFYPPQPVKTALVDVGDDGDPIPATVPHNLVEELPDGTRDTGASETAELERRGQFEYVVKDITGMELVAGAVDPERLSIGIVTNLIQDSSFLSDAWPIVPDWTFGVETSGDHDGMGYLRSISTTLHGDTPPYGIDADSTYFLTPPIPAEVGRGVRVSAFVRRNSAATATTLGIPLARLRVIFVQADGTLISGATEFVQASIADLVVDTWNLLSGTFIVPNGVVSFQVIAQTVFQSAGTIDFIRPEAQVLWDRVQSSGYEPGVSGFRFDEDSAQVATLQVVGELGAAQVNADMLTLGGVDFSETLSAYPRGIIVHAFKGQAGGTGAGNVSNTELRTFELNAGILPGGRVYEMRIAMHVQRTVADDAFDFRMKYTTNGSEALVTSTIVAGGTRRVVLPQNTDFIYSCRIEVPTTAHYRFAFTMQRAVGTGTGAIYLGAGERRFEWDIVDLGASTGDDSASLSQKLKQDGTGADNPPITTVTSTWNATTSSSYWDNDDGLLWRVDTYGQPMNVMEQGYKDSTSFHIDASLCMFDYTNIVATLGTAVTILSCKLRVTVKYRFASTGLDLYVATHNYAGLPDSFQYDNTTNIFRNVAIKNDGVPGSTYVIDLGTTVGGQFKAGTRRGIGLVTPHGDKGTDLMGYIYGIEGSSAQKPQLQITYTKSG